MNIFATDDDPVLSAWNLDDKRLPKMILETAQLLSTAVWKIEGRECGLYKPTHTGHPCTLWTMAATDNFMWLVNHGEALNTEYRYRFEAPDHKSVLIIRRALDVVDRYNFPRIDRTEFANCTNLTGNIPVVKLYRQYMIQSKWGLDATWRKRGRPEWAKTHKV